MFRQLSKHFPDRSSAETSSSGQQARQKLNRALLFGVLLLGISVASPFLLSDPQLPSDRAETVSSESQVSAATDDRTPAPADPSPVDFNSPGVIIAVILLAGGIGLALYLRNGTETTAASTGLIVPVAEHKLSSDQRLQLVRCADEVLLLGISADGINLLKTYPADKLPAQVDAAQNFNGSPFKEVLQTYAAPYMNGSQS